MTEYRATLAANSKASAKEIALIGNCYEVRLENAIRRGIRIKVDYSALGLDKSRGVELACALPRVWNTVFSKQFRTFIDSGILGIPAVVEDVDLSSSLGVLEGELQLAAIRGSVIPPANQNGHLQK